MNISLAWLKDFILLTEDAETIGNRLTGCGLEVEGVETADQVPGGLRGLVIGQVMECEQHPNADRLRCTKVDVGQAELLSIVCGAPNVAIGQKVVVATVGATLYPNGGEAFEIKKSKIRGELSEGMICAEDEIGLGQSHDGILVLDTDLPVGTPAAAYFKLESDQVFSIGLTPNRADAASHLGVARDLKALYNLPICTPSEEGLPVGSGDCPVSVKIIDTEACPRYSGICVEGIKVGPSPAWLQNRLKAIGLSPINNIVDVTNYVLHGFGQPLHAFDASHIAGNTIIVRQANAAETIITLDEVERKLQGHELLICDSEKPLALAGVFGGLNSGINENTTRIFIESAYFNAPHIRKSSLAHGLKTDASFRYERGTDPWITVYAAKLAAKLITEVAGGQVIGGVVDVYPTPINSREVKSSYSAIDRLLGIKTPAQRVNEILTALDIRVNQQDDDHFVATVPPYRVDVDTTADLAEEVLRIQGLDAVPLNKNMAARYIAPQPTVDAWTIQYNTARQLAAQGFNEVMSTSLTHNKYAEKVPGLDYGTSIKMLNRLSEDLESLRVGILPSLLEAAAYNVNRRQPNLKIFEFGKVYWQDADGKRNERMSLGLLITGNEQAESWQYPNQKSSIYTLKQAIENIGTRLGLNITAKPATEKGWMDYGLTLHLRNQVIGECGAVGKVALKLAGLKQAAFVARLDWTAVLAAVSHKLQVTEIPKFPEVRRDLSMVLDRTATFAEIQQIASKAGGKLLQAMDVFDVYEGAKIGEGKKSYAISFKLQDSSATLTDQVIDSTMERIMQQLESRLQATIRKA